MQKYFFYIMTSICFLASFFGFWGEWILALFSNSQNA